MPRISAGLLMYRFAPTGPQVLLVHPGGPFWKNKDAGAWSIPKGEANPGEDLLACAQREFQEETGVIPAGEFLPLGSIKQKSGKLVHAWAFAGDCDPAAIQSNTFPFQWPPKSGKWIDVPEVDRADFFGLSIAREKINPAQVTFIDRFEKLLSGVAG